MSKVILTHALAAEYLALFQTLEVNPSRFSEVDALVTRIVANRDRYEAVGRQASAVDALQLRKVDRVGDWSTQRTLYELEGYNGWGYRLHHPHVKSPYLWSFSNHYTRGKYIADGTWSDSAVSGQCGAAVLVRRLEQRGEIATLDGAIATAVTPLRHATRLIARGEDLQRFLNTFPGISLRVDGWTGNKTSDAVRAAFGFYLAGDPRSDD